MTDIETLLARWQAAGVVDAETAARIRMHEAMVATKGAAGGEIQATDPTSQNRDLHPTDKDLSAGTPGVGQPSSQVGLHWQGVTALILGAILLACGVVLFVSAHWDEMGPGARYTLVCAMVAVFHIAGGLTRASYRGLSMALHAVGTIAAGAAIALVGQIFNIQEHWPAAVLLWALAALAGWMLLRDQAQQTLALVLIPAWLSSELWVHVHGTIANDYIGADAYIGRVLFVWAILYITFFVGSRRRAVQWILFAGSAVVATIAIGSMLQGWESWAAEQSFVPFSTRVWAWIAIAGVPLIVGAFHGHKGLVPIGAAIAFVVALPWCNYSWARSVTYGNGTTDTFRGTEPNVLAYVLVAGFAVFLCWWGVRLASRAMVNLGVVGFAAAVAWFYFSDVMSKMGRSLGLIGLGVLFLAGGWALEKMRRRMLAGMQSLPPDASSTIAGVKGEA
jgi:uncharacterized membrane protein